MVIKSVGFEGDWAEQQKKSREIARKLKAYDIEMNTERLKFTQKKVIS
ncbi:MAG: hypothetical protein Q8M95_01905 [Candidatus Methanoperedens sp.]|nr:hypothetical protein [Candidatus Methanoperedens sp.]